MSESDRKSSSHAPARIALRGFASAPFTDSTLARSIAAQSHLSPKTVDAHRGRANPALPLKDATGLAHTRVSRGTRGTAAASAQEPRGAFSNPTGCNR